MSLQPAKSKPLSIWKGATYRKRFVLHTGSNTSSPVEDLTDYTGEVVIRSEPRDAGTTLLTLNTDNGGVVIGDDEGFIEIFISDEDTADLVWETGHFGLSLTAPNGDTDLLLYGTVTVRDV